MIWIFRKQSPYHVPICIGLGLSCEIEEMVSRCFLRRAVLHQRSVRISQLLKKLSNKFHSTLLGITVREYALSLSDATQLLAKLATSNMVAVWTSYPSGKTCQKCKVAKEARYHSNCLAQLYNHCASSTV